MFLRLAFSYSLRGHKSNRNVAENCLSRLLRGQCLNCKMYKYPCVYFAEQSAVVK